MKFLSKQEIKELTGYTSSAKAIEVLTRQGIGFVTDVHGNIKTTWDAVNAVLIDSRENESIQPNFSHLR